ncbi:MAG: tetratricopeptide repeat protein [Cryomorphaceae bacterium]|nr:tetratricopeptide repeat protein [Flavobacteriales bacterium]
MKPYLQHHIQAYFIYLNYYSKMQGNPKLYLFAIALLFAVSQAFCQKTESSRTPDLKYYESLELMKHSQFEAARKGFSEYIESQNDNRSELTVNAIYYRAQSAMELFHKDSEYLMEHFVLNYPESMWYEDAVLDLGNYNFNRRDYDDALRWLNEIDERDLNVLQKQDVQFKKGFSAFELEKFEESKRAFYELKDQEGDYRGTANYYYGHIAYTEGNYQTAYESFQEAGKTEDFKAVVPYYITQIYHFQEKYDELIAYATPLIENEETIRKEEMAHLLGDAHFKKENYEDALPYLEMYMERTPNPDPEEAYQMAYAYYRSSEYAKSIDYFAKAAKSEKSALVQIATYQMADAYVQLDEKKFAQNAFKVASQMYDDTDITEDALFNYAKLAYELSYDPFHEAIKAFEKYLDTYPDSSRKDEAFEFLLNVHLATRNYSAALDAMDNMKTMNAATRGRYQECAYNYAVENMNKRKNDLAFQYFKESKKYPQNPKLVAQADYWMGDIHYKNGEFTKAVDAYESFLSNSAAYQTPYYNLANYNMGYCQFKAEDYEASLTSFRKFITGTNVDEKRKTDAHLRIGDLQLVRKNYDQAVESYQEALDLGETNADYALFQMAQARGYQEKHGAKIGYLNELFDRFPQTSLAAVGKYELGDSYFSENKLDQALGAFNSVVSDYPESPYRKKALLKRGLVQYRLGKYDDAIATYKSVVSDYGVDSESSEAIATLKSIYLDLGKVDEFTSWLNEVPDYEVSPSEMDSLSYQSAENAVASGDCDKAIPAFQNYLESYPNGLFAINANYYIADCAYRKNNFPLAIEGFEFVAEKRANQFSEPALLGAASIRYSQENYEKALGHYKQLKDVASFESNVLEAEIGIMRCAYELGNYEEALLAGDVVISASNTPGEIDLEAKLLKAEVLLVQEKLDEAETLFDELSQNKNSKEGAESQYRLAEIAFKQESLTVAEDRIFTVVQEFPSYDFWKIKAFLLLADVYRDRDDFFQSRATLESIVNNVSDSTFVNAAREKLSELDRLENEAIQKGDSTALGDTLDYEEDYKELMDEEFKAPKR